MNDRALPHNSIPAWARWAAALWLLVWAPTYWVVWGPSSFLFLCDLAVVLTCVGIIAQNALLISSQAISSLLVDFVWFVDIAWTLIFRRHLIFGTEYFFDPHYPLIVRLMSTFHIVLPIVLLLSLRRTGYDPRAFRLQSAIAVAVLIASRFAGQQRNINFAFADPFNRTWGPAPVHLLVILLAVIVGLYLPTHAILLRVFRRAS